jgi:hypothetical protein
MLVLSTPFVISCHSTFSLASPTPPPFPKETYSTYIQTLDSVWLWGGGGGLGCVVDHILNEFKAMFLARFRTYQKLLHHPKQKHQ